MEGTMKHQLQPASKLSWSPGLRNLIQDEELESNIDDDDGSEEVALNLDSDSELQEAFKKGLLKPGLNIIGRETKRSFRNEAEGLKKCLGQLSNQLPWLERLDMVVVPAKAGEEMKDKEAKHAAKREIKLSGKGKSFNISNDPVHNDFKRELHFYQLAQSAVLEGIPKLKVMGVKTKRPDDYFAEMAKSDNHMQRVRHKLLDQKLAAERSEKAKHLRELRKFGKATQIAVQQQRQKEKRELMEKVKKFHKGQKDALDFLDEDKDHASKTKNRPPSSTHPPEKRQMNWRRQMKDKQYGFGGQKKRSKYNSKESVDAFPPSMPNTKGKGKGKGKGKSKGKGKGAGKSNQKQRPGKARRQKMHARKKR
ncbi:unnamed protein product [Darwinula stevensoni]|uniref:Uncharacterized protein n=1 Tax=Darwinula stevensoni TaxID=69355 RepID=A0A7R8X2P9_9CRUS|nr:unnamed protein product [Darwinula stevensoni]CAG0881699.1 unnamed protein product [Darwinula stevensoni]